MCFLALHTGRRRPPPTHPLKCCFPRDREENAAREEGNTQESGQSVGIRAIIKYSCHRFSPGELAMAVCFVQRQRLGERAQRVLHSEHLSAT